MIVVQVANSDLRMQGLSKDEFVSWLGGYLEHFPPTDDLVVTLDFGLEVPKQKEAPRQQRPRPEPVFPFPGFDEMKKLFDNKELMRRFQDLLGIVTDVIKTAAEDAKNVGEEKKNGRPPTH